MKNTLLLLLPIFCLGLSSCKPDACDCLKAWNCIANSQDNQCLPVDDGADNEYESALVLQECEQIYNAPFVEASNLQKEALNRSNLRERGRARSSIKVGDQTYPWHKIDSLIVSWEAECIPTLDEEKTP
ncbi:MAG: hypothetical protein ACPGYF_02635 [Chitinophagales bacterium]